MVDLSVPSSWGTYEFSGERHSVDDGTLTVDDEETARAIADSHTAITLPDGVDDSESDDDSDDEFDADAFLNRNLDDGVIDDIKSGDYDEHLDAIASAAGRETVRDAVDERRDELEG